MGISTHILDVARGRPADDVTVSLEAGVGGACRKVADGRTDADGRVKTLLPAGVSLSTGTYRITFLVSAYLQKVHGRVFFPEVTVSFVVENPAEHFHVPLLLRPFGYSTYRGS